MVYTEGMVGSSVWLVRHYDYESQEVKFVASSRASARKYIKSMLACPHSADYHDPGYTLAQCRENRRREVAYCTIERWRLDTESAVPNGRDIK